MITSARTQQINNAALLWIEKRETFENDDV